MRTLASIQMISNIVDHPNADAIELATVRGWQVVVKKGDFKPGDKVIYLEIDSWVPTEIAPFLSKGQEPRIYEGVKGERLRTIRLRGAISQGLILPITVLEKFGDIVYEDGIPTSLIINKLIPLSCEDVLDGDISDTQYNQQ